MAIAADKAQGPGDRRRRRSRRPRRGGGARRRDVDVALPVVVKPVDADNSTRGDAGPRRSDLGPAIADALDALRLPHWSSPTSSWGERCGAASSCRDGELVCLPLEEYAVDARSKPVRRATTSSTVPPTASCTSSPRTPPTHGSSTSTTRSPSGSGRRRDRCHVALGCRHYSLFDFRIDPDGDPWFLEAGLYCSFSRRAWSR